MAKRHQSARGTTEPLREIQSRTGMTNAELGILLGFHGSSMSHWRHTGTCPKSVELAARAYLKTMADAVQQQLPLTMPQAQAPSTTLVLTVAQGPALARLEAILSALEIPFLKAT